MSYDRDGEADGEGPARMVARLGRLATNGAYPTRASVFYAVQDIVLTGPDGEGASPAKADAGLFLALNLGGDVPPLGSEVLCTWVDGRWIFGA